MTLVLVKLSKLSDSATVTCSPMITEEQHDKLVGAARVAILSGEYIDHGKHYSVWMEIDEKRNFVEFK
jgi:choline kinase